MKRTLILPLEFSGDNVLLNCEIMHNARANRLMATPNVDIQR